MAFLKDDDGKTDSHRHFSMSEGIYRAIFETQLFLKRTKNPVFIGGTSTIKLPLNESDYGYKGPRMIDLSFTVFSKKSQIINGSIGGSIMLAHTSAAYWNGSIAANSKSVLIIPGISGLWNLNFATLSINLQKPIFLEGAFSGSDGDENEQTQIWQLSIGIRRLLDYRIPWLYW